MTPTFRIQRDLDICLCGDEAVSVPMKEVPGDDHRTQVLGDKEGRGIKCIHINNDVV